MREDELLVQVDGLLVVSCSFLEFTLNEVELCAVIVNVRVLSISFDGFLEVVVSLFLLTYIVLNCSKQIHKNVAYPFPDACWLA
jgi:hypothetical protein